MGNKISPVIKVTAQHISTAVPESSSRCMIADAIKDSIPGSLHPHVDMQTIRYTDSKGVRRTYLTPGAAQAALVRFDAGDEVSPFTIKLHHPIHINKVPDGAIGKRKTEVVRAVHPRPRVGGRQVPTLTRSTRRRFGIRGLRINQQGQVVQSNTTE